MHDEEWHPVKSNAGAWVECPQSIPQHIWTACVGQLDPEMLANNCPLDTGFHTHTHTRIPTHGHPHPHPHAFAHARTHDAGSRAAAPRAGCNGIPHDRLPRLSMTTITDIMPGEGTILVTGVVLEDGIVAAK